ncbi:natural killer cells antigen CD94-like isoform X2 [Ornithorhynchus anatinus]|uniref:natural killer cells antigen CD94-like isoform X2 n=1 Tax=Ornithorhynchus anatinus TaxID=9258 RepID=UPI0010A8517E|nr:natural killer cells antigen CD94-like isoform X2 [Ornithorhynchus anatinus]
MSQAQEVYTELNMIKAGKEQYRRSLEDVKKKNKLQAAPSQGLKHFSPATGLQEDCSCRTCPETWFGNGRSCYYVTQQKASWHTSKTICASLKASLLQISSREELDYLKAVPIIGWMGLSREGPGAPWKWLNSSDEPSNVVEIHNLQDKGDCTVFRSRDRIFYDDCGNNYPYICEA